MSCVRTVPDLEPDHPRWPDRYLRRAHLGREDLERRVGEPDRNRRADRAPQGRADAPGIQGRELARPAAPGRFCCAPPPSCQPWSPGRFFGWRPSRRRATAGLLTPTSRSCSARPSARRVLRRAV